MGYKDLEAERRVQKCTLDVLTHTKYRSLSPVERPSAVCA